MSIKRTRVRATAGAVIGVSGVNHQTARIELREKLAAGDDKLEGILERISSCSAVHEAVCCSTCNRTEVVVVKAEGATSSELRQQVEQAFFEHFGIEPAELGESLYHLGGQSAVRHLFRVASGLDSLIIGETQILGQLKRAFATAKQGGFSGSVLNRLFENAFKTAKKVRSETDICAGAVSICYAAKELAMEIFGPLDEASVLLCGAGDTAELMLKHLRSAGVTEIVIANRTVEKAAQLVSTFGGAAVSLDSLAKHLTRADIVIGSCTLSAEDEKLFSCTDVGEASQERESRPQFFIDLGVPRNFDESINTVDSAFLYNIDDLASVADSNRETREEAAVEAEELVSGAAGDFTRWLQLYTFEPIIKEVYLHSEEYGNKQIETTLKRIRPHISGDEEVVREALSELTRSLSKRILDRPVSTLRAQVAEDPSFAGTFEELFESSKKKSARSQS